MKRIFLTFSFVFLFAGSAVASWMGETWLWVRVEKVHLWKRGSDTRKVDLRVKKWARGAGHGDQYGRSFPGKTFTVDLKCANYSIAHSLKPGQTFWVKHRASTSFFRKKNRIARTSSHRSWTHLSHALWVYKPVVVKNLLAGENLPASPQMEYLWAIRHGDHVTLKLRHNTVGKRYADFRIINISETKDVVSLSDSKSYIPAWVKKASPVPKSVDFLFSCPRISVQESFRKAFLD